MVGIKLNLIRIYVNGMLVNQIPQVVSLKPKKLQIKHYKQDILQDLGSGDVSALLGNHDRDGVWISILINMDFYDCISPFSPKF